MRSRADNNMKEARFSNKKIKSAFIDKRGKILDILEEPIGHVGHITFTKGAVRANHYHKKSVQYSYVLEGKIELTISDTKGKNKRKYILTPGTLTTIPTYTVHTYKALTKAAILDMTTYDRKGEAYENDTFRI